MSRTLHAFKSKVFPTAIHDADEPDALVNCIGQSDRRDGFEITWLRHCSLRRSITMVQIFLNIHLNP